MGGKRILEYKITILNKVCVAGGKTTQQRQQPRCLSRSSLRASLQPWARRVARAQVSAQARARVEGRAHIIIPGIVEERPPRPIGLTAFPLLSSLLLLLSLTLRTLVPDLLLEANPCFVSGPSFR